MRRLVPCCLLLLCSCSRAPGQAPGQTPGPADAGPAAAAASVDAGVPPAHPAILTNHLGYERSGAKRAVVQASPSDAVSGCELRETASDQSVAPVAARPIGALNGWRSWRYWTLDFDSLDREGTYAIVCGSNRGPIRSFPFVVQADLLLRSSLSDVLYYFKAQRSSGPLDQADRHLPFEGAKRGTLDAHGGWWDATGDYGEHLSHL
jgi:Cellulase N-terminal ig-like domain